jgi:hypothetical protein
MKRPWEALAVAVLTSRSRRLRRIAAMVKKITIMVMLFVHTEPAAKFIFSVYSE